ncbi:ABC transporter substrate-binding protein [Georgenia sp. TF02-10]|uniref:ABC transporter substrate-binding protein n=1 Tax=Georgenia sp. TF02-10 TaxID=2917725 RepID=UPI001FA72814|nr:ABC transporter substrate-binding protein [Georgenia sp. TF02-10]UNX53449.1 ABC transporter substrate-binding protein [Georgenia sp. TF02-10]
MRPRPTTRRLTLLPLLAAAGALTLASCTNAAETGGGGDGGGDGTDSPVAEETAEAVPSFDASSVTTVDEIAAMLPADFDGTLTQGVNLAYAPAEFRDENQDPVGYDVDLARALANVLGAELEVSHAEFASIIPGIGTQYDMGLSSFSVTPERLEQVNMITYLEAGSTFSVQAGNPQDLDPENLCGATMGVQTGTIQDEQSAEMAAQCEADGEEPLEVLRYNSQADVTTNLVGGKIDVMYADSPVGQYAALQTDGQVEQLGEVTDAAPQGIVVAKDDAELTAALQAAMQHLMDEGTWAEILDAWGITGALSTAELNPAL